MSFSDSDDSIPPPPPPPPPVPHRPNSRPDSRQSESTYGGEQFELNLAELSAVPGSPLAAYAEKGTSNNKLPTAYAEKGMFMMLLHEPNHLLPVATVATVARVAREKSV